MNGSEARRGAVRGGRTRNAVLSTPRGDFDSSLFCVCVFAGYHTGETALAQSRNNRFYFNRCTRGYHAYGDRVPTIPIFGFSLSTVQSSQSDFEYLERSRSRRQLSHYLGTLYSVALLLALLRSTS